MQIIYCTECTPDSRIVWYLVLNYNRELHFTCRIQNPDADSFKLLSLNSIGAYTCFSVHSDHKVLVLEDMLWLMKRGSTDLLRLRISPLIQIRFQKFKFGMKPALVLDLPPPADEAFDHYTWSGQSLESGCAIQHGGLMDSKKIYHTTFKIFCKWRQTDN